MRREEVLSKEHLQSDTNSNFRVWVFPPRHQAGIPKLSSILTLLSTRRQHQTYQLRAQSDKTSPQALALQLPVKSLPVKRGFYNPFFQFSSVQLLSRVRLFVTPWTPACQDSLVITNSRSLPKPVSIELVMPSNHLVLCHPLLLLPSTFPSIRVVSNEAALLFRWP